MLPCFSGVLSPYWNPHATGSIVGLSYNNKPIDVYRACLEGISFSVRDCVDVLEKSVNINTITVDGGVSESKYCMQFQADILNRKINISNYKDCTPLGVALGAALGAGYFKSVDDIKAFNPNTTGLLPQKKLEHLYKKWKVINENNMKLCGELNSMQPMLN